MVNPYIIHGKTIKYYVKIMEVIYMRGTIVVNKDNKMAYIPRNLIRDGYIGKLDTLANFNTVTLLRPGSSIDDQIESIELVAQDLKMRKRAEEEEEVKAEEEREKSEKNNTG